ncbi:hypothetical protein DNHGIG_20840 [Collibacillus ludicampi]|jgi:uncharacterized protein (TIGR03578 family)|uniref:DUF4312 family protein n=1 Tax=Collibacillus ludicampi TaxID=2771369 RepID=A0AAV4LFA0_9BACL|nr:DUF4312 family protein [Collibacillus ludicampi]GIM46535.1 hypothetical protein DNHGIG_20840 [Collibacillus ludicampi]
MYKSFTHTLTLSGVGETKEAAFNKIFSQIQRKIAQDIPGIPLRIEPQNVEIIRAKETIYTERFMGIFFPRKRTRYEITAQITVQLRIIDVSKIEFEREEEHLTRVQHLIRME